MPLIRTTVLALSILSACAFPQGGDSARPVEALTALKRRLRTIIRDAGLTGTISLSGGDLVVKTRVKTFSTTGHFKDKRATQALPEEGPDDYGFQINANLIDHLAGERGPLYQAVKIDGKPFRTVYQGGYWLFDAVDRQVKGTNWALHFRIAWGRKLNPKLLAKLNATAEVGTDPISG